MSDWDEQWEKAHEDCKPKGCSLYGTSFCQTGCTLRWEWEDDAEVVEYEDCPSLSEKNSTSDQK